MLRNNKIKRDGTKVKLEEWCFQKKIMKCATESSFFMN
jgi:hypothetical protein